MKIILLFTAIMLAGCASPGQHSYLVWVRPGATQADFNQTNARCRIGAAGLPRSEKSELNLNTAGGNYQAAGRDLQDASAVAAYMEDCFTAEGWTRERRYQ